MKQEIFGDNEELKPAGVKKQLDKKVLEVHEVKESNNVNPTRKFNSDYMIAQGVSPLKCRHPIDLYGVKSGVGCFNPIMVENINKKPEKRDNSASKKSPAKPPSAQKVKPGMKLSEVRPTRQVALVHDKKDNESTPQKKKALYVLSNQNKARKDLDTAPRLP